MKDLGACLVVGSSDEEPADESTKEMAKKVVEALAKLQRLGLGSIADDLA